MADLSRRSFLKTGFISLAGLSVPAGARALWNGPPQRIGIIGGGLAGVSCAWLLAGVADTILYESRSTLGGHAQSIDVEVDGQTIPVDVGSQFFAEGPHPTYSRLLELVGLLDPDDPGHDSTIGAEMTITLMQTGRDDPRLVSPSSTRNWPLVAPWNYAGLLAFLALILKAKPFDANDGSWFITLEDWLAGLPLDEEQREKTLLPLLSAMIGCSIEQARGLSARNTLAFIVRALPDKLLDPIVYNNSTIGLGGNVEVIAAQVPGLDVRVDAAVTGVSPLPGGGFRIRTASREDDVDAVVFAAPPYVTSGLLGDIPWQQYAAGLLDQLEFFPAEIAIHRDPVYMPARPWQWSAYNTLLDGDYCEASVWYGALRPVENGGSPLPLFKSWATARAQVPQQEIFRRAFLHPLITPKFIGLQRLVQLYQGLGGVWFAGSWLREIDSQETALLSAMDVVGELFPNAPNLLALQ